MIKCYINSLIFYLGGGVIYWCTQVVRMDLYNEIPAVHKVNLQETFHFSIELFQQK